MSEARKHVDDKLESKVISQDLAKLWFHWKAVPRLGQNLSFVVKLELTRVLHENT